MSIARLSAIFWAEIQQFFDFVFNGATGSAALTSGTSSSTSCYPWEVHRLSPPHDLHPSAFFVWLFFNKHSSQTAQNPDLIYSMSLSLNRLASSFTVAHSLNLQSTWRWISTRVPSGLMKAVALPLLTALLSKQLFFTVLVLCIFLICARDKVQSSTQDTH